MSKRDGSHLEFLDCEPTPKHDFTTYNARYICINDTSESNCNDVHLGGAEGTIVKLPQECGFAAYGVIHEIRPSANNTIPPQIRRRAPINGEVLEVSFSYDFTRVKRASIDDPVYIRIDYGSESTWYESIVDAPPVRRRGDSPTNRKRFWSEDEDIWKNSKSILCFSGTCGHDC